jgi:hypothetical protein
VNFLRAWFCCLVLRISQADVSQVLRIKIIHDKSLVHNFETKVIHYNALKLQLSLSTEYFENNNLIADKSVNRSNIRHILIL